MPVQVSVIMPVYNMAEFVKEAVESILWQTFSDIEFIIIDDASDDSTSMIINSYQDDRIVLCINDRNVGNYYSRNKGFQIAQGKYIAVMDADDVAMPDRLEKQFAYLEKHSEVLAVGSNCVFMPVGNISKKPSSYREIQLALLGNNCFIHSSLMLRANIFQQLGGYNERYYYSADYDLVCRMAQLGKIEILVDPLIKYRFHSTQITAVYWEKQRSFADEICRNYQMIFINRYKREDQFLVEWAEVAEPHIAQVIAYYTYASYSGNMDYEHMAGELLDQVFEMISEAMPIRLERGMLGITCGLVYLLRNKFVEGEEVVVLEDIDRFLFCKLVCLIGKPDFDWYGWLYYCRIRLSDFDSEKNVFCEKLEFLLDGLAKWIIKGGIMNKNVLTEIELLHRQQIFKRKTAYIIGLNRKE
ncbi:glycosyltransferase [Parabacteroides johnsonii]|uniref:glycosyltransferase n=1 Tax=Parabacteroides johnsonii TaxID=387661 RepID=UPI00242DC89F|nr:glycosyltransferase [Parabacteroides johnsonii]